MSLKSVKEKIISTKKIGKVTKAMEAVSAVKMRKSQERAMASRPYVRSALKILSRVSESSESDSNKYLHVGTGNKRLLVIVTSDKGLAGSVNSAVLKKVEKILQDGLETDVITVGKKALDFAAYNKLNIISYYTNLSDDVSVSDSSAISKTIFSSFDKGVYGKVEVVYQNFISTFEQSPTYRTVLPLDPEELHYIMDGIKPKTGKGSVIKDEDLNVVPHYTIEPSPEEVLNALIPTLVGIIIYHSLVESKASEHSARMVAMKSATDKSKEVVKLLNIQYNKARQTAITAEVSEITAGVEAMK